MISKQWTSFRYTVFCGLVWTRFFMNWTLFLTHLPEIVSPSPRIFDTLNFFISNWPALQITLAALHKLSGNFYRLSNFSSRLSEPWSPKIKNKFLFFLQCSAWHIPAGRNDVALLILFLRKIVLDCSIHT